MRAHRSTGGWGLAVLPLGWVAGTALQLQQRHLHAPDSYTGALWAAAWLVALAWLGRRRLAARGPALLLLCAGAAALGAWGAAGARATVRQQQALAPQYEGMDLVLTGIIADLPQHNERGWRFVFDVEQAVHDGQPVTVPPRLQLSWYTSGFAQRAAGSDAVPAADRAAVPAQPLRPGDRWRLVARLKAPHGNVNPHGFDYELWLWSRRIGATGYLRINAKTAAPELLAQAVAYPVQRWRQRVRDRILALAPADSSAAAQQRLGIVAALTTGDQNAIERGWWEVFRITGVAHLVSISGLHIGMMAWLAALGVGWLWRESVRWRRWTRIDLCSWLPAPHAALVGGLIFGVSYAVFSGWGVPAQRTVVMLASVILLRLAGLRWPFWLIWLWAATAVLVVDPWAFLQAGFWLSFVAVGILFVIGPRTKKVRKGWRGKLRELVILQSKVTLALAPLTLILFGQASVVGLLANIVAIPWVTLVVTPTALAGLIWPMAWQLAAWSLWPMLVMLQWMAALPWAQLTAAAAPLGFGVAAALGALIMVVRLPWSLRAAGLPLFVPLLLWQPTRPASGDFDVLAIDIGQGSAVLVRTAGHTLLYDTGPRFSGDNDAGERVILPLLQARGERLDKLVLSHRDSDHTGGAAAIHAAFPQAPVLASLQPDDVLDGLPDLAPCEAGVGWRWDGVLFEVLYPTADDVRGARSSNAISCILRVSNPTTALLLTGDIEAAQERTLVQRGASLRSDIMTVPHHGSNTSSTMELLQAVRPRLALNQAGYRNSYGHPTAKVLARYADEGVMVLNSPHCGAMHWQSTAPTQVACERERSRRYWRFDAMPGR